MTAPDSAIARKHIEISLEVEEIAKRTRPNCRVFVATYTTGASGKAYQQIEEESGHEFWSVKAWTPPPMRRLKDPDVIVTEDSRVTLFVEIKWGAMANRFDSDLMIRVGEQGKLGRLPTDHFICRVRGPAVRDGKRYRSREFRAMPDYWTDEKTRTILVSDFVLAREGAKNFSDILTVWKRAQPKLLMADISRRVDEIPSLQELLERIQEW